MSELKITLLDARLPVWSRADKSSLDVEAKFSHIPGWTPFTATDQSGDEHVQEVWDRVTSGEYGTIARFSEKDNAADYLPDEISRRQFFQFLAVLGIISRHEALGALQSGNIPTPLQEIIDQLPTEDEQFEAQMFIIGAQNFNRMHWLTDKVRQAMNWTLEQRDEFWRDAAQV